MGAVQGHKVLVELTSYGDEKHKPEGRVKEIIGHINDPGTDILSVVYQYELPNEFPEKVMRQAEKTPQEVHPADMEGRLDLRDVQMVTIDGEDAKDLDDAVSLTDDGEWVPPWCAHCGCGKLCAGNSALDQEASVTRHQCLSGGPGDSDAAAQAFKRHLLSECRDGSAGNELYHGHRRRRGVLYHIRLQRR